ncbi:hypothetical protein BBJ28_00001565 [Nothophytophthora sp. Chile5]|nr:hypothetical protein BBJ28_00001565 [Nothophytophthora sp. Chile5]
MAKPSSRESYAVTSATVPALRTLGLEEEDPEDVFELQRKEGAGAFGRVFRACYKSDRSRLAALKVIPVALEAGQRGEDIESVRREIQFLRECDHPNVVAFHGAYYKDGALWVAMEHCAGGSVGDVRRLRPLSEREISVIMRGALQGLAYLHARRKIHRDVKGGNILLTASGQVKIADFGVSAQLRDTLSRRGSFVGTPYWMSPELIQDSDYDSKADIWSLGITAIELADQKPPLFDEHPMRVLIQIPRNPPPQVAHPEKWSSAFLDFLRFCLRKDPAERPTALECMQHEFICREQHIERVFASGEQEEAAVVAETAPAPALNHEDEADSRGGDGPSAPVSEATVEPTALQCETPPDADLRQAAEGVAAPPPPPPPFPPADQEEITEEIVDETVDDASSESSASTKSDDEADGEASTGLLGHTFEFRDGPSPPPACVSPSSDPVVGRPALGSSADADGLLNLSTAESFELTKNVPKPALPCTSPPAQTDTTPLEAVESVQPSSRSQHSHHQLQSVSSSSSLRQPPTEFKLLPASAKSPVIRGSTNRFAKPSNAPSRAAGGDDPRSSPTISRQTSISSLPPTASVRSSWLAASSSQQDDPLASIDTVTNARVNRLLSSFSVSSSSPSLVAAMHAYSDQYAADALNQGSTRQSFNWRSVEVGIPSVARTPSVSVREDVNPAKSSGRIFISDPFRASHDVCVKYNSLQAQYEGAPASAEWDALHQQFGISLAHMRCRSSLPRGTRGDDQVPALLRMLRRELVSRGGLRLKYIYRVSPVQDEVSRAKTAINRGSFDPAQVADPHVYASLLKLWLRDLPEVLLDALDGSDLSAVAELVGGAGSHRVDDDDLQLVTPSNFEAVNAQITRILRKLGAREKAVLEWLLEHLLEVNAHREANQMTTQALATVMAPNLFSFVGAARVSQETAGNLMRQVVTLLRVLLAWRRMGRGTTPSSLLHEEGATPPMALATSGEALRSSSKASSGQARLRQSLGRFSKSMETRSEAGRDGCESGSLEQILRNRIDRLWEELQTSEALTAEAARQEQVARRIFHEFQHSMLELVSQCSKRSDERAWADEMITRLASKSQVEVTTPPSLGRLKPWVDATLSLEEFRRLLEREQATRDKLEQLKNRFGGPEAGDERGMKASDLAIYSVLHRLTRLHRQEEEQQPTTGSERRASTQSNQKETRSSRDSTLLDGAERLAVLNLTTSKHDAEASSRLRGSMAKLGERQPAIGNLLALVGSGCQNQNLELGTLQCQLLERIQAAVALHQCERHEPQTF